jgi:hypothetical protein
MNKRKGTIRVVLRAAGASALMIAALNLPVLAAQSAQHSIKPQLTATRTHNSPQGLLGAPEIDVALAAGALTLIAGGAFILRGRRRRTQSSQ